MDTTEIAKKIREQIKKATGLNSRQVSVKALNYLAVKVEVKNLEKCDKSKADMIEEICVGYNDYDRCESSGEILSSPGNTYIHFNNPYFKSFYAR